MNTDTQPVIRLENTCRLYRDGDVTVRAVDGVTLTVPRGDLLCITGPSGSGKTTLLGLMAGLVSPTSGAVFFDGRNLAALPDAARAAIRRLHIGFVFQEPVMLEALSTWENVALPLAMNRKTHGARLVAETWLNAVGLKGRERTAPRRLSTGQRKRAALARALAADPPVILADEPTSGLDRDTGERIMDILCRAAVEHGKTVIFVTHDPHFAARAPRIIHMQDGTLHQE
jgi:putative ABC transport system ATP-binding protein